MVDPGREVDLWRLEGIVDGEVDEKEEDASGVWAVGRPHDCRLPMVDYK